MSLPPFLDTHKLRELHKAAQVYATATGNQTLAHLLGQALSFAESLEPESSYDECINCGGRVPKGRRYCCFDCAEEDGAVEK